MSNYEAIFGGVYVVFMILYVMIVIGAAAAFYILNSIGLSNMAKKLGYDKPWLAWIPGACVYLMCMLPTKEYKILVFNKTFTDRKNAFWAWLILLGAGFTLGILSAIPFIGWIIAILAFPAVIFGSVITGYPMLKDLFDLFHDNKKAMIFSIVSIAVPAAQGVFFFITGKGEPKMISDYTQHNETSM